MPRWRLEYYVGTPYYPRSVEAEFDDLLGESIRLAHEYVRKDAESRGEADATLKWAKLVVDREPEMDPLDGDPKIPCWITYIPYRPDDDPDSGETEPQQREEFHFPARLFETTVTAKGEVETGGPMLGFMLLAIRRRLADGREGTILKIDHDEEPAD